MQKKFLQDLKRSLSCSCLASLFLLFSAQASDSTVNLLHSCSYLFRENYKTRIS